MPKPKKVADHLILATSLEDWARAGRIETDPYVTRLVDALKNRKNLAMWASLNPMEFLPHGEIRTGKSLESLNHALTVLRNTSVFLPVALTWIAVSKATTAFSLYTSKNSVAVVNFLEFWQNGYGVLAKKWTIGRIAFIDFALIVVVIGLTLSTAFLARRNQNTNLQAARYLDEARTALALDLVAYLHTKQAVTPLTMNANMATALRQLLNATDALDKSTSVLEKKFKEIPSHRDLLLEIKAIKNQIFKRNN